MTVMTRTRQPEETRARIIEAAIEAADELGAGSFTLDAVVSRLSLSKGALLHHFPSKRALLEGVIDHLARELVARVTAAAAEDPDPYVTLSRAYLRVTIQDVAEPGYVRSGRVALIACLIEPELAARWHEQMLALFPEGETDKARADDALMLRLLADGLWLSDIMGGVKIPPDQRQALMHLLCARPAA